MTLNQLKTRQETLLKLIANVGGRSNVRKWVDELMAVEAQIEDKTAESAQLNKSIRQSWDALACGSRQQIGAFARHLSKVYPAPQSKTEASLRIYIEDFVAFALMRIRAIEMQAA